MSYNETLMKDLLRIIPQKGKVEWIGVRSKEKEKLLVVESPTSVLIRRVLGCLSNFEKNSIVENLEVHE